MPIPQVKISHGPDPEKCLGRNSCLEITVNRPRPPIGHLIHFSVVAMEKLLVLRRHHLEKLLHQKGMSATTSRSGRAQGALDLADGKIFEATLSSTRKVKVETRF